MEAGKLMEKIETANGSQSYILRASENQALGLARYARIFMESGQPAESVLKRAKLFHSDALLCGISALAQKANAPTVLRNEALMYSLASSDQSSMVRGYARVFGSDKLTIAEKAICANCSAVREWDSNGTVFGFREGDKAHQAGEFGHNDFYSVIVAAAQQLESIDGATALKAMVLSDEIRGRLAEAFSLKTYKIDHVVYGAISSAVVYGLLLGATDEQIESAVGMVVAHYIPFRAIRSGHQLSDSKGASAAISTEVAIMAINRSMLGFIGPKDIFRNPASIFRLNEPTQGDSPFDIILGFEGDDFAVMGMHFKLGLYEHQSAGAIHAVVKMIHENNFIETGNWDKIKGIKILAYEPAFHIIGDPAKMNPRTRQSADHSMVFIISALLKRAIEAPDLLKDQPSFDDVWKTLMLTPLDYRKELIDDQNIRNLMAKISFAHGGEEYDIKYPDGIPTSVQITLADDQVLDSGFVMYPKGHARNTEADLEGILEHKFKLMGQLAMEDPTQVEILLQRVNSIDTMTNQDLRTIYCCDITLAEKSIDE